MGKETQTWLALFCLVACLLGSSVGDASWNPPHESMRQGTAESFSEDLLLRPLPDGNVMAHFTMSMSWPVARRGKNGGGHYSIFPKAVGELVQLYGVAEFHLSFSRGQWLHSRWGHSPLPAPQGAQLWAWLDPATDQTGGSTSIESAWLGLTNALSGLFGSSLNFLSTASQHVHPTVSFKPLSSLLQSRWGSSPPPSNLFYGSLPREVVCTENLTPWIKLLPCRGEAGLARLLRAERLCGALYSSYSTHVTLECGRKLESGVCDESSVYVLLRQTVTSVSNAMPDLQSSSIHGASVRAPPQSFAVEFSFNTTMAHDISSVSGCSLAGESWVHLHIPSHYIPGVSFTHSAAGAASETSSEIDGKLVSYDVTWGRREGQGMSLQFKWALMRPRALLLGRGMSHVTVHRYLSATAANRGKLVLDLENHHPTSSALVHVFDLLPWFVRVYLHTATLNVGGEEVAFKDVIKEGRAQLAGIRDGMTLLEYSLVLPPESSSTFLIEFEKGFLHIDEHPPDANRGFDLPAPAIMHAPLPQHRGDGSSSEDPPVGACKSIRGALGLHAGCTEMGLVHECLRVKELFFDGGRKAGDYQAVGCVDKSKYPSICGQEESLCVRMLTGTPHVSESIMGLSWPSLVRAGGGLHQGQGPAPVIVYAESVLLVVPTPDFSMPYNVITLTCTVLALFYGSVFNILTRKLRESKKDGKAEEKKPKKSVLEGIKSVFARKKVAEVQEAE